MVVSGKSEQKSQNILPTCECFLTGIAIVVCSMSNFLFGKKLTLRNLNLMHFIGFWKVQTRDGKILINLFQIKYNNVYIGAKLRCIAAWSV